MANISIKLSELLELVKDVINDQFFGEEYYIIAETSDIKNYPDRSYCFVTLVEKEGLKITAKAEAVIWSKNYHIISEFEVASGVRFERNIKLLLKVSVDYSQVYGLKLQIMEIDASYTLGNLELQRQQIIRDLITKYPDRIVEIDGELITSNKRLARPVIFKRIAVISAPGSDGLRDFKHELENNPYGYCFILKEFLCQLQGNGAEEFILQQMKAVKTEANLYEALVIVRGGGSQLDFGPFDTYELGAEIAGFPVHVITGIGHERNVSIADMMAHLNLKTPTKAADFLIEHNRHAEEDVEELVSMIITRSGRCFANELLKLGIHEEKLRTSVTKYFTSQKNILEKHHITMQLLSPENIIKRGFAMIKKNNIILNDSLSINMGDNIEIVMKDGIIETHVNKKSSRK